MIARSGLRWFLLSQQARHSKCKHNSFEQFKAGLPFIVICLRQMPVLQTGVAIFDADNHETCWAAADALLAFQAGIRNWNAVAAGNQLSTWQSNATASVCNWTFVACDSTGSYVTAL